MDSSSFRSFAQSGIDDPLLLHQWRGVYNSIDELSSVAFASSPSLCEEDLQHSISQQTLFNFKRAHELYQLNSKQLKSATWNSYIKPEDLQSLNQSQVVLPKEEAWSSSTPNFPFDSQLNNYVIKPCKRVSTTSAKLSQDHVIAERKRREKISQKFIALSALVPGLKKMDKASILEDAIKHMKHLQDKVKVLEKQTEKRSEAVVSVNKYELCGEISNETLPEVEARLCDRDVLITIHCKKINGMLEKAISEIEKLHMSIVNSCVMSFGDSTLNITIIAKKDEEVATDVKEVIKNLNNALKN